MKSQTDLPKLSKPAQRALAAAGIYSLEQLSLLKEDECLSLHGVGKTTLPRLNEALKQAGLSFRKK